MDNSCGIYRIDCDNKCLYVGQSINLRDRMNSHLRRLRKGTHFNIYLQRLYNKYGDCFVFSKVEECKKEKLTEREMYWIEKLNPMCNMQIPSDSTYFTVNEESRKKMSEATKSRMNEEMKKKISERTKEAMQRPEVRERFLQGQKNKKYKEPWNKGLKGVMFSPKNKKAVYCKELDMSFDSMTEASLYMKYKNIKGISKVCNGERKSYKGMHWNFINE